MISWQLFLERKNGNYSYSSTQVNLPDKLAKKIIEWGKKHIPDQDIYDNPDDNCGREDEIHTTVLYGLHTNEPSSISDVIENFSEFKIKLTTVSKFSAEKYDVIKIGVESEKLHELNKKLAEFPNSNKYPSYIPHITIAYVLKDKCNKLVGDKNFEGEEFTATHIVFSGTDHVKTPIKLKK